MKFCCHIDTHVSNLVKVSHPPYRYIGLDIKAALVVSSFDKVINQKWSKHWWS